jgi:hypothetical protein
LIQTEDDGSKDVECGSARPSSSCAPDPDFPDEYLTDGRCDGTTASSCQTDGSVARLDCASLRYQRRCVDGKCVATGTECDVALATTCDGSSVVTCHDGFVNRVDCAALGFTGCADGHCTVPGAAQAADSEP